MHKLNKAQIKIQPKDRLYDLSIPIIGLTGSIATGKSTVSKFLTSKGVPLIDADYLVKEIYKTQECLDFIKNLCPESVTKNEIDFKILRKFFFDSQDIKLKIENYLYERLPVTFNSELAKLDFSKFDFLVYDVPLLFEKNLQDKLDLTIVCYTPQKLQIKRLMKRDSLSHDQALKIINSQISIESKKKLADHVIDNSGNLEDLHCAIDLLLSKILN